MPWLNIDWKQILDIGSYHRHLGNTLFFDKTDIFSRFFLTWNRKEYSDKTLLYFLLDTRGKRKEHTQCRVFSGPYFPLSELNMEIYGVNLRIQSEYKKIRTRKKLCIWPIFTQCMFLLRLVSRRNAGLLLNVLCAFNLLSLSRELPTTTLNENYKDVSVHIAKG